MAPGIKEIHQAAARARTSFSNAISCSTEPVHHHLQPATRVETFRPCVGIRQRQRLARCVVQVGPFGFEEGEVAHGVAAVFRANGP